MHLKSIRIMAVVLALGVFSGTTALAQTVCQCQIPDGPPNPHPYLVGYLGVYKNADWDAVAKTLDFTKMTHLNLAFINPPICAGPCTAAERHDARRQSIAHRRRAQGDRRRRARARHQGPHLDRRRRRRQEHHAVLQRRPLHRADRRDRRLSRQARHRRRGRRRRAAHADGRAVHQVRQDAGRQAAPEGQARHRRRRAVHPGRRAGRGPSRSSTSST